LNVRQKKSTQLPETMTRKSVFYDPQNSLYNQIHLEMKHTIRAELHIADRICKKV